MQFKNFKLVKKRQLTKDIYELIFKSDCECKMIPGQFITFILDKIGGRAYSISKLEQDKIILIIKKRELENKGRGGSKYICELELGSILRGVGPSGHFTLKENNNNKLFIGTGTGFSPLFNQITGALKKGQNCNLKLLFGVRTKDDIFYLDELKVLKEKYPNFDFTICLSRDNVEGFFYGYTVSLLDENLVKDFNEYYICGIATMIDSTEKRLLKLGVIKEKIFYEKY